MCIHGKAGQGDAIYVVYVVTGHETMGYCIYVSARVASESPFPILLWLYTVIGVNKSTPHE